MTASLHVALLSSVPAFSTALRAVVDQGNVMQPADTKAHHLIVKDLPLDSECSAIAAQPLVAADLLIDSSFCSLSSVCFVPLIVGHNISPAGG
jgi:hypothetical protein